MKKTDFPKDILSVIDKIEKEAKPVSIFVYGSRARDDFKEDSDYEVGVIFSKTKRWERIKLAQLHNNPNINIYSFVLEEIERYIIDTPFPKAVYLKELVEESITIAGENIIRKLKSPQIKLSDLIEVIIFETSYALGALLSARKNDLVTASIQFSKAVLFAARALVILESGKFPLTHKDIYVESKKLKFLDVNGSIVINHAMDVRNGKTIDQEMIYKSLRFLNQSAYTRIKNQLKTGDRIILPGHPLFE
ncbi:MAG: nucleotidyltransferase domain-containing protein [Candidatus Levybacteria bacterium]|nr:nucleotidyltransferase domain-containing protein [Candidatus Levybacteria bacterium]